MTHAKTLFGLAEKDDAQGLITALGDTESYSVLSPSGETLLLFALYRGCAKCVDALKGRSLTLHEAAALGDARRVEACLSAAPWTLLCLSADGWPALHLAAYLGHDEVVFQLLDAGADALQWSRAMDQNLAVHAAAAGTRIGRKAYARVIEATGGPDVTQKGGYTALMIAAGNGFKAGVDALLAAGADPRRKLEDGRDAARFARERGHPELADRLG